MNDIQIFENAEFGKVRTVMKDGEPWFVASDVCESLELSNPTVSINRLDGDERAKFNLGRQGEANIVNEYGLYNLILGSRKPEAKKFKRWITHEVLPSIRKTGSYRVSTLEQQMAQGLLAAQKLLEEKDREIEVMQPKADFYDAVADSESLFSMAQVAKVLDMGIGRNKLFKKLRDWGVLDSRNNPYQRYVDAGYFKLVETHYMVNENSVVSETTYVKQKGVDFIRKKLLGKEQE